MINKSLINKIHLGDCVIGMQKLPNDCADLVVADPPYNLNKDFGLWNEKEHREDWLPWSRKWLDEVKRILKPGGNVFVYGIHHHLCWIQCYMYEIGLTYRRQIIWYYENGFAGYSARSLAAHYEPILWFSKSSNYTYHTIREPYKSEERLKYKITKNGKVWKPNPEGRLAGDVWRLPTLAGRRFSNEKVNHPTQKPLSISLRLARHFSNEGDLVVVPFAGSGSECLAALMEKRRFIGFELNPAYVELARKRLSGWKKQFKPTLSSLKNRDSQHP
jgi:site-specific DNA-methyltransferase (adenine-specific)/adenine-specific DNA-methyltransferase